MADPRIRSVPDTDLDTRAAARAARMGDRWEHMGEEARDRLRRQVLADAGQAAATATGAFEILRATYTQIGQALDNHRGDDPFVLVDPVTLLGWSNAVSAVAGQLAAAPAPSAAVLGSTTDEIFTAIDRAHWASGPLHERINRIIDKLEAAEDAPPVVDGEMARRFIAAHKNAKADRIPKIWGEGQREERDVIVALRALLATPGARMEGE